MKPIGWKSVRSAFTLAEVAISLVILAVAVLSTLALLPSGLRAQQMSRMQLIASAAALTLMEAGHNPMTSLDGFGDAGMADEHQHSWIEWGNQAHALTGEFTPSRGFAWNMQRAGIYSLAFAPDLEKQTMSPLIGLTPVPDEIAKRLDSEGDEIKRIIEAGGHIYYLTESPVRGLTWGAKFDLGQGTRHDPIMQRIVVGIVGAPQQNALIADPYQTWPWYELYPFPPNWYMATGFSEKRLGPNPGPRRREWGLKNMNGADNVDIDYFDGGHDHFALPSSLESVGLRNNMPWHKNNGGANDRDYPSIGYIGYNWEYHQTTAPASLWATPALHITADPYPGAGPLRVWQAFRALAVGDVDSDLNGVGDRESNADGYGDLDGKAGWMAVARMLGTANSSYSGTVVSPVLTQAPGKSSGGGTYEMKACYRDRAIMLWNVVRPSIGVDLPRHALMDPGGSWPSARSVVNANGDVDRYEVPPESLRLWQHIDPVELHASGEFPPHPTQVLALSFLAHSAMLVAGHRPPWREEAVSLDESQGANTVAYQTSSPFLRVNDAGLDFFKDIQLLASDAATGSTSIVIKNNTDQGPIIYYDGDCLWFEDDPERVHRVNVAGGAIEIPVGASAPVGIDQSFVAFDDRYENTGFPGLGTIVRADSRVLRVASPDDITFARMVHEMCLRWAVAYAGENNNDFGAPRPSNRQLATDRPLAMFDLWYDAGARALGTDGQAQRVVANRPQRQFATNAEESAWWSSESFYRWISPVNPATGESRPSHLAPFTTRSNDRAVENDFNHVQFHRQYQSMIANRHLREPSSGNDARRYWLNRTFDAEHRTRQIVAWSVDWKAYEDFEMVPSAILDRSKHALFPSRTNSRRIDQIGSAANPQENNTSSFFDIPPETFLVWNSASRTQRAEDHQSGSTNPASIDDVDGGMDIRLGQFGADRNGNARFDRGSVPRGTRMKAVPIVRFNYYDPIIQVHAGN